MFLLIPTHHNFTWPVRARSKVMQLSMISVFDLVLFFSFLILIFSSSSLYFSLLYILSIHSLSLSSIFSFTCSCFFNHYLCFLIFSCLYSVFCSLFPALFQIFLFFLVLAGLELTLKMLSFLWAYLKRNLWKKSQNFIDFYISDYYYYYYLLSYTLILPFSLSLSFILEVFNNFADEDLRQWITPFLIIKQAGNSFFIFTIEALTQGQTPLHHTY